MSASRFFKLEERGTTAGREVQAGVTTFAAMAYILAVNPSILADAGMDRAALVTVTALSAATATALMALLTNYPLALAPGMGINAFFTYTICIGAGVPWQQALGMVFVNGVRVPAALGERRARARGARHPLLADARDHRRHRPVHRLHRAAQRRRGGGQPGHLRHARGLHQRPDGVVSGGPGAHGGAGGPARARRDRARRRVDDARRRVRARRARRHGHRLAGCAGVDARVPGAGDAAAGPVVPARRWTASCARCRSSSRCCSWTCSTTSAR